jgi:hypothetical protein
VQNDESEAAHFSFFTHLTAIGKFLINAYPLTVFLEVQSKALSHKTVFFCCAVQPYPIKSFATHEIFDFRFFSWISFPQAPGYTIRTVSNCFENSRRYSQLKVHHHGPWHRWQMEKSSIKKGFNYFVWTPLVRRVNI